MPTEVMVPARQQIVTLHEVEEHLAELLDTEALVSIEQQSEFQAELGAALKTAVEKRDRVAQFLTHCEAQMVTCDKEIKRLQDRKGSFERAIERLEGYVVNLIQGLGYDDPKGKKGTIYPKLEGKTATLSIQRNPPSVVFDDEAI